MSLTAFINTTFAWSRQVVATKNPMGAANQTFTSLGDITGNIQPASSATVAFYAVEGIQCTHTVFTTQQGFQAGDNLESGGVTYGVLGEKPYKRFSSIENYSAVDVRELKL
jgi:hypothetical protein